MAKKQYYDISNIMQTNAQYMILLGQRANGKSYQAKKEALTSAYDKSKKFVYLRRWKDDIKAASVEKYFVDMVDFIGIATDKEEFKQNFATFFVKMYIKEMCGQEVEIIDNNRLRHLVFNLIQEQKDGTYRLAVANREFAHP